MANFTIITDAETVNNTFSVHQIDLDTMLQNGQCEMQNNSPMEKKDIKSILDAHQKWISNEDGGARANLTGANLTGADLTGADLTGANLTGADLTGADLTGANLTGADLTGANLTGADLTGANLYGADLYGANLTGADLYGANLTGADLYGADLTRANLTGADLTGANLTGADLYGADLYGANLTGADLTGANLTGADLTGANLTGAKGYFGFGPMPTSGRIVHCVWGDDGWAVQAGCFWGSLDELEARVKAKHNCPIYLGMVAFLRTYQPEQPARR